MSAAIDRHPKVLHLRMSKVPFMDTTGEAKLTELVREARKQGVVILISGIKPGLRAVLERSGLARDIGPERIFAHTGDAISHALTLLDRTVCKGCTHQAFFECAALSRTAP